MQERKNIRVPFRIRSEIRFDSVTLSSEIRDLSTNGLFVVTYKTEGLKEGSHIDITLHLEGSGDDHTVKLQGTVVRIENTGFAVSFLEMDLDSFFHLRNIVAYNSLDQDKIIHEFEDSFKSGTAD